MKNALSRRHFLHTTAAASLGLVTLGRSRARAASPNGKLRVLSIGVVGTIGSLDRKQVAGHPEVEIAGLCDVDSNYLAQAAAEHPQAFTCRDYREAFAKHADKFSGKTFPIHYSDSGQQATAAQLRIPEPVTDSSMTVVVCEGGTMVLDPEGGMKIWRDGKATAGLRLPGLPAFPPLNHWHAWVDNCLGKKTELRTPFKDAVRITEATLLAVKATRFPGQELRWDKSKLAFTNHPEATNTIVRRQYRDGFAPPPVA